MAAIGFDIQYIKMAAIGFDTQYIKMSLRFV